MDVHSASTIVAVALFFPGAIALWAGIAYEIVAVRWLAHVALSAALLSVAIGASQIPRWVLDRVDAQRWRAAGSPKVWAHRPASQPRALDVVVATVVWAGLLAIYVGIAMNPST
jgi:type IV secretory pathway TraG/TraD family ATPase VirD4